MGILNPEFFLGGKMKLNVKGSENAIKKLAQTLGLDVSEVSLGIAEVSNANMLRALRTVSVVRGYDPRDYTMVAFGGAGPMVAAKLAEDLMVLNIVIPTSPGVTSAFGLLVTDIRHDFVLTRIETMDQLDPDKLNQDYKILEEKGRVTLKGENIPENAIMFTRSADIRYVGQGYEVNVPVPSVELTTSDVKRLISAFHEEHARIYGHSSPEELVEIVNLRVNAIGVMVKPELKKIESGSEGPEKALKSHREVFFKDGAVSCPIYDRYKLLSGNKIEGPAIIEEVDSTTVVYPSYKATVDDFGNIVMTRS
jgi:N-methylhydantoinase A